MIRRRGVADHDSSDEEEEDMFEKLTKEEPASFADKSTKSATGSSASQVLPIVPSITSSMKRHHITSTTRKKVMDSLIQELETEKSVIQREQRGSIPKKRGSFVDPDEEQLTTNLFVGNLAPTLTEEAIYHVFEKFGELLSLKVMWPRTAEDRERNRVSCFVCYRYRQDAEAALDACSDSDPFHVGRRLMVRWGKSVELSTADDRAVKRHRLEVESKDTNHVATKSAINRAYPAERRRGRPADGSWQLEAKDLLEFHNLTRRKLCVSRRSICEAMAFCFEHSSASTQICQLLKDLLLEKKCSVDTEVSRLYLLSDVLFNSQQPGIRNAFRYRDAIAKMAPAVFASLGQESDAARGRMTRHKIQVAIRAVLAAWAIWSVFDPSFLDELEACFDKGEIVKMTPAAEDAVEDGVEDNGEEKEIEEVIILAARGDWTEIDEDGAFSEQPLLTQAGNAPDGQNTELPAEAIKSSSNFNEVEQSDIDGDPFDDDELDEAGLRRLHAIHSVTDDDDDGGTGSNKALLRRDSDDGIDVSAIDDAPLGEEEDLEITTV